MSSEIIPKENISPLIKNVTFNPFDQGKKIGLYGLIICILFFGSGFLWLALAPLNGAVIMPAQIKIESSRKQIQHREGGIVKSILVKSGDHVIAGQALVLLEQVQLDANLITLKDQLDAETVRNARAKAERTQKTHFDLPDEILERSLHSKKLLSIIHSEQELFNAKVNQLSSQLFLIKKQKQQVANQVSGLNNQIASADHNKALIDDEKKMNEVLAEKGFIQKSKLMAYNRAMLDKDEQMGTYRADMATAEQKVTDLDLKAASLRDDYIRVASDEFTESNRLILELQEKIRPIADSLSRETITAPVAGEVMDLKIHTEGGTIQPSEVIMEIVPEKSVLILEGKARPEDISELVTGSEADVQITAFKQRNTPHLKGKVSYISADSIIDTGTSQPYPYYLVHITINAPTLSQLPAKLGPGMPAIVYVKTRERTALDYLLAPIDESMRKAFKER